MNRLLIVKFKNMPRSGGLYIVGGDVDRHFNAAAGASNDKKYKTALIVKR